MFQNVKQGKKRVRFSIGAEEDHDGVVEDEYEVMEVEEQGDEEDEAEDIRQMVLQQKRGRIPVHG